MQSKWKRAGQRVGAAKRWLAKAEEEFSQERPVRGELNLLLAEAELKRLKESEPSTHRRWLRHSAAVLGALLIAGVGAGAWWMLRPPVEPALAASSPRVALKADFPSERQVSSAAVLTLQHAPRPEPQMPSARLEKTEEADVRRPPKATTVSAAPVVVTDDELRQLVRKAGQTLRGQQ